MDLNQTCKENCYKAFFWSPSEASSTTSMPNDECCERSAMNVVDDGLVNDRY